MTLTKNFENIFEPALIKEINKVSKQQTFNVGSVILEIGQPIIYMPIVINGTIKITRLDKEGQELLLYYVTPNESCAMTFTCCMPNVPSEIKAIAEDEATVLFIPVENMDEWLVKYPTWKSFVMNTVRLRFNEMLKAIDHLAFEKLDERLVHYLKDKAEATGSKLINLSHEQIANELASSRAVISRLLKRLENDKKLLLYRHQIKLLSTL